MAAVIDGMNRATGGTAGASHTRRDENGGAGGVRNGGNLATVYSITEVCWGDVGLVLTLPRQGLGNAAIAAVANDEQLARFGHKWVAMAITEPGCGSDPSKVQTTAVLDGDEWVINGEKIFVTTGCKAEGVVLWATLDKSAGRAGIKSFLIEKGTPGFLVPKVEDKLGLRASDTAEFVFEDCRVPAANRLGEEGEGFKIAMKALEGGRIGIAAQAVGIARAALEASVAYARERKSFGVPIAQHQQVQWMLADMAIGVDAARLLTWQAASLKDQGQPYGTASAMAKLFASETAMRVATDAVQVHGGYGYVKEFPVERFFRDAKITQIYEGTSQIQRLVIARALLDLK